MLRSMSDAGRTRKLVLASVVCAIFFLAIVFNHRTSGEASAAPALQPVPILGRWKEFHSSLGLPLSSDTVLLPVGMSSVLLPPTAATHDPDESRIVRFDMRRRKRAFFAQQDLDFQLLEMHQPLFLSSDPEDLSGMGPMAVSIEEIAASFREVALREKGLGNAPVLAGAGTLNVGGMHGLKNAGQKQGLGIGRRLRMGMTGEESV